MNDIDSPSGIDLRPEPPNPVRLSKRAGLIALVVVTAVVGLVGYGIATRRQRTAAAIGTGRSNEAHSCQRRRKSDRGRDPGEDDYCRNDFGNSG